MTNSYQNWHLTNQRYTYDANPENNPRDVALRLFIKKLKEHAPELFTADAPMLLELGCGPGYILNQLNEGLHNAGVPNASIAGMDLSPDYLAKAQATFNNSKHYFAQGDVFDPTLNPATLFDFAANGKPMLSIASHVGYYGYGKKGENTAKLEGLVNQVQQTLGEKSLGIFIHIIDEAIDQFKRPCTDIVESDTGKMVRDILNKNSAKSVAIRFARDAKFPVFPPEKADAYWDTLVHETKRDETGNPYPNAPELRDARYLLEFSIHKDLADLTPEQRSTFVRGARELLKKEDNTLHSAVEIRITVPENASAALIEKLRRVATDVQQELDGRFGARSISVAG